ncbi:hypothetical protein HMN09_00208300 [Mycena chlorophos]|uniref:Uncharacterized protein n=1 Tax=Mycena chlorophos TaxID=658473 RepID=A0A8H6WNF5_MYCCL|nr:hypothetical protein HMN09_00208300 [Mycena chlorophos]
MNLQQQIQQLSSQNQLLLQQNQTLMQSNTSLLSMLQTQQRVPALSTPSPTITGAEIPLPSPIVDEDDIGTVFYTQSSYNTAVNEKRQTNEDNPRTFTKSACLFATDAEGNFPSVALVNEMKHVAHGILTDLANAGRLPSYDHTYMQLGQNAKDTIRARLESRFPDLRIAQNHWKVDAIVIQIHTNWKNSRKNTHAFVKSEPVDNVPIPTATAPKATKKLSSSSLTKRKSMHDLREDDPKRSNRGRKSMEDEMDDADDAMLESPRAEKAKERVDEKGKKKQKEKIVISNELLDGPPPQKRYSSAPNSRTNNRLPPITKPATNTSKPASAPAPAVSKQVPKPRPLHQPTAPVASSSRRTLTPPVGDENLTSDGEEMLSSRFPFSTHETRAEPALGQTALQSLAFAAAQLDHDVSPKPTEALPHKPPVAAPVLAPAPVPVPVPAPAPAPASKPRKPKTKETAAVAPAAEPGNEPVAKKKNSGGGSWQINFDDEAKNLCAYEWKNNNKGGKKRDYVTYWNGLDWQEKAVWNKKVDEIRATKQAIDGSV